MCVCICISLSAESSGYGYYTEIYLDICMCRCAYVYVYRCPRKAWHAASPSAPPRLFNPKPADGMYNILIYACRYTYMYVYICICKSVSAESSARFIAERSASETASARACIAQQMLYIICIHVCMCM